MVLQSAVMLLMPVRIAISASGPALLIVCFEAFSSNLFLEAGYLVLLLYDIDGGRCRVAGFGLCLLYLELQLGHFELMLPCSFVFFIFLLSE